jgi:L-amino acid N-acyltransferase YncA
MVIAPCSSSTDMSAQTSTAELIDGSVISIRQLAPSDAAAVSGLYQSLSDEERYLRFFTMHPAHLENWARSISEPGNHQYSLGAFSSGKLLGVANYIACQQPGYAEVSVVVAHAEHLRGVGTALLRRLGEIARQNGLHHLVAEVLAENHPMNRVLSDAGWPCTRRREDSVLYVDVDLDVQSR